MPTVSHIQETVDDRYYERGGEDPLPPRLLACPICSEELPDETALAVHLGSDHPLSAPRLLLDGGLVVGERILHRPIDPQALAVANASRLLVAVNGAPSETWTLQDLRDALAGDDVLNLDVELFNDRSADGIAAKDRVRLRLDVPDPEELAVADASFQRLLASERLDEHRLDEYAEETKELTRAGRYASALHEYATALLVKDRARGTGEALSFHSHREKHQRALDTLRHFPERPIARAVCGFVRFELNDIHGADSGVVELDRCVAALREFAGRADEQRDHKPTGPAVGRCPTDDTTNTILSSWEQPSAVDTLLTLASGSTTTPEDAAKCRALALRLVAHDTSRALTIARGLSNDPVFGAAATAIIEDGGHDG